MVMYAEGAGEQVAALATATGREQELDVQSLWGEKVADHGGEAAGYEHYQQQQEEAAAVEYSGAFAQQPVAPSLQPEQQQSAPDGAQHAAYFEEDVYAHGGAVALDPAFPVGESGEGDVVAQRQQQAFAAGDAQYTEQGLFVAQQQQQQQEEEEEAADDASSRSVRVHKDARGSEGRQYRGRRRHNHTGDSSSARVGADV